MMTGSRKVRERSDSPQPASHVFYVEVMTDIPHFIKAIFWLMELYYWVCDLLGWSICSNLKIANKSKSEML